MDNIPPQWQPNYTQLLKDSPGAWSASVAASPLFQNLPSETLQRVIHLAAGRHPRKGLAGFAAASSDCHTLARPFLFMNMYLPAYQVARVPGRHRRIEQSLIERLSVCTKGINDESIAPYVRNLWIRNPPVPSDPCYRLLHKFTGLRSLHLDGTRAIFKATLTFRYILKLSEMDIRYLWIEGFEYRPEITYESESASADLRRRHFTARSWRLEQLTLRSIYDTFDVPSQSISADLLRLCGHIQLFSSDVHPCLDHLRDYPLPKLQSFQLDSNDCYNRFSRQWGSTDPLRDHSPRTPIYDGSFTTQIESLSVNTASISAHHLLSQTFPNISTLQTQISRNATLLLHFLSLHPHLNVLSIQHTQPHASRVDEWSTFTNSLGTALHRLPHLRALQLEIDDEDLTPAFITALRTLPHLKSLCLGAPEQRAVVAETLESWPAPADSKTESDSDSDAELHFPALERLVLDVKRYAYLDTQGAGARPNFDKLTMRNAEKGGFLEWMRLQAERWGKRCPKLKWILMYRVYSGGMEFVFEGEGDGRRGRAVGGLGGRL